MRCRIASAILLTLVAPGVAIAQSPSDSTPRIRVQIRGPGASSSELSGTPGRFYPPPRGRSAGSLRELDSSGVGPLLRANQSSETETSRHELPLIPRLNVVAAFHESAAPAPAASATRVFVPVANETPASEPTRHTPSDARDHARHEPAASIKPVRSEPPIPSDSERPEAFATDDTAPSERVVADRAAQGEPIVTMEPGQSNTSVWDELAPRKEPKPEGTSRRESPVTCDALNRFWVRGDYVLWWTEGNRLPALVTTSPAGTPQSAAGVWGEPGTRTLFGGSGVDDEARSGVRIEFGYWLDCNQCFGIEAGWFGLENGSTDFARGSGGDPILARPFFNAATGLEDAQLIAFPGVISGDVRVSTHSDFRGAELLLRRNVRESRSLRVDVVGGYRFLGLDDELTIREALVSQLPASAGALIEVCDQFKTENQFHGATLGVVAEIRRCRWTLDVLGKLGIGGSREEVEIDGCTTTTLPGQPSDTYTGGLLAQRSNIGHFSRNEFAWVPELGVNFNFHVTDCLQAHFGYSLIYWSNVVRSGDQIDTTVNATQIPPGSLAGAARPAFQFHDEDFWAQGINFGVDFRF